MPELISLNLLLTKQRPKRTLPIYVWHITIISEFILRIT